MSLLCPSSDPSSTRKKAGWATLTAGTPTLALGYRLVILVVVVMVVMVVVVIVVMLLVVMFVFSVSV